MNRYFNAISTYRVSRFFYNRNMKLLTRFFEAITYVVFKCYIPGSAKIGKGTYCSHRGMSVVIHPDSIIGEDCVIGTCVTLGGAGKGKSGAPKIKDNVYLGTGCKLIGKIEVGDNVVVGANSVITKNVESNCTIVGIPGRKVE